MRVEGRLSASTVQADEDRYFEMRERFAREMSESLNVSIDAAPTAEDVASARKQKEAYDQALAEGLGAINVDGVMVDAASIRIVQNLIDRADLIGI